MTQPLVCDPLSNGESPMSKSLFFAIAVLCFASPAKAQLFGGLCQTAEGPCASIPNQLVEIAKDIEIIVQTTITAVQEVLNTTPLGSAQFQDLTAEIQQITQIAQQADLLINNPALFINNLNAPYYPLPQNGMQQTILHSNTIGNAIQQLGNVIDTVNPSLASRATTLASLTTEALAAIGRMQNQQDTHQALVTTGQDIHALTTLQLSEAQAHHSELLAKHDRQAMADAWLDQAATVYTPYPMAGQDY